MVKTQGPALPRYMQVNYDALADRNATALSRLGALRSVKANLDSLESTLVYRARNEGATWDAIGMAMGITRQGVQKRYALGPNDD